MNVRPSGVVLWQITSINSVTTGVGDGVPRSHAERYWGLHAIMIYSAVLLRDGNVRHRLAAWLILSACWRFTDIINDPHCDPSCTHKPQT